MRKGISLLGVVITAMLLSLACTKSDFLDPTVTTSLNEGTTFSDSANAMAFLNSIYVSVGLSIDPRRFSGGGYAAGLDAACDEAEGPNASSTNGFIQFATGSVNPSIIPDDSWSRPYTNIRSVNQFLAHLPTIPFNAALKVQSRAEAHFLRAWYYFIMLEHYGGVPIIGDSIYTANDKINAQRSSFRACVEYIAAECDSAALYLPTTQSGSQYGRASRGASLALKSRLYLYAASPLFNNGGIANGTAGLDSIVAYPDADPSRWQRAADAAQAVIALNAYELYVDSTSVSGKPGFGFQKLFSQRYTKEYIFQWMMGENKYLESLWDLPTRGGSGGPFPYQQLVDAFPMSNGLAITDPSSGYDPNNPYKNRDPRLDYTVIHDSTFRVVFGANQPAPALLYINTAVNPAAAASGDAVYKGTPTGFYIYKMLDSNVINNSLATAQRCLPLMRYAEILLNYAEAANEVSGPTEEVYNAVAAIRQRAGLRPYTLPTGMTQDEMREAIHNERRLELAYEGHRFFDVRRWMTAETDQNLMMKGMEVDRDKNNIATYKVFDVRKHNFSKAMYLWPIPISEITKSPELQQNPLY